MTQAPAVLFTPAGDTLTVTDAAAAPLPLPHEMIQVTPEVAWEFLAHVGRPRPLSGPDVERYKRDMLGGRWDGRNSECLTFSTPGAHERNTPLCRKLGCAGRELIEGFHRLNALIRASEDGGLSHLWMEFAFDVAPSAMDTLDSGHNRSDNDRRAITGGDYSKIAPAVARRVVAWQTPGRAGAPLTGFKASPSEIAAVIDRDADLMAAASRWGIATQKELGLPASMLGFGYWLLHQIDPGQAGEFLTQVSDGLNLEKASPARLFRVRISRAKTSGMDVFNGKRANEYKALALLCMAWNEMRIQVEDARKRLELAGQGHRPPRPRAPVSKLQLPEGKLTMANFPLPK